MYRPEYDMEVIGRNLKRLREAKKLTVEDVREYLRLGSVQAVYKYEKGKSYPQVDTMFALMELYGADLKDIVCECEEDEKSSSFCFIGIGLELLKNNKFLMKIEHFLSKMYSFL